LFTPVKTVDSEEIGEMGIPEVVLDYADELLDLAMMAKDEEKAI
jgi:hypothetical protein